MKYRSSIFISLLLAVLVFGAFYPRVNFQERESMILHAVMSFLHEAHFTKKDIDDKFSKTAYKNYLEYLDGGKRFLVQSDIDQLNNYELEIDDQAQQGSFEFFDLSMQLINDGIDRTKNIYEDLILQDFNFETDESIDLDYKNLSYPADENALRERWRKSIKYEILNRFDEKVKDNAEAKGEEVKTEEELLASAKQQAKKMYDDWFKRLDKMRRSDRFEFYLNSMTHEFDPHSDYFNPKEKQDFDINMGGKLEGIGARLSPDGDYTKVLSIVPGGPAWKGKKLEVNDLIIAVTQKGEETLDITGMRLDDVVQKIRGKKGTVVILTCKKENGEIVDVEITRDVVNIEATFAKSLQLDIPDVVNNIGYIKLPKFYSSFERKGGNSCSIDVAAEIEKLNAEGVNGIILDLRYNGGCSLRDVVDMTGLFIESGPIVQVKPREAKPYVYKDKDPKVRYDGPLVVMVNNFSASASEILAAALQDYNRAVIVGSTSTFGKGTVQRFFDLDNAIQGANELKPLGQVKMTMQKFYRVNGGSTQLKGVNSDIVLPDNYAYIETGEREYGGAMAWTKIDPVLGGYEQEVYQVKNMDELKARSQERIAANDQFSLIVENAHRFKAIKDNSTYPLSYKAFSQMMTQREEEAEKFESIMKDPILELQVKNLEVDLDKINLDEATIEKNKEWLESVQKDIYIEEALHILADMKK